MKYKEPITGEKLEKLRKELAMMDTFEETNPAEIHGMLELVFEILKDLDIRAPRFLRA